MALQGAATLAQCTVFCHRATSGAVAAIARLEVVAAALARTCHANAPPPCAMTTARLRLRLRFQLVAPLKGSRAFCSVQIAAGRLAVEARRGAVGAVAGAH